MNNLLSDHDKELVAKFKKLISDDSLTIDFMFHEYFGSAFERTPLKPLHTLKEVWITAAYEFEHPDLNNVWLKLKEVNRRFLKKLALSTYPRPTGVNMYYFGERHEDSENIIEANIKEVNNLARMWCQSYNHFTEAQGAAAAGRQIPPPDTTPNDPDDCSQRRSESEIMSVIHSLDKDVHEDWKGVFCTDDYLPLIKLSMPKYRGEYHVIAWEKSKRRKGDHTSVYDLTLYVAEGNNAKARTYSKSDTLYKVTLSYATSPGTDILLERIFKNKVEGKRIINKTEHVEQHAFTTEEDVAVRPITPREQGTLLQLWPDYFDDTPPPDISITKLKTNNLTLTRPCRILTGAEATFRYSKAYLDSQTIRGCGEFFNCPLAQWGGNRHICVGIKYYPVKGHNETTYRMSLLLTSHPPLSFNRVALILWVLVPDQDEESFVYCDGEIARPSIFDGKDNLKDSAGEEWTVLDWHVRDDLLKEETEFFDEFFLSLEQNSTTVSRDQKHEIKLLPSGLPPKDNKLCSICGWIHTTDCSRWEHPNTYEVVTTSKKRAKLLFKLHSGMEKDCGDTSIDNFIEDEDRKAGYQAGDILGDKLQTLLYFSTKRGRGRIRKPDEKALKGRPSKKKK